MTVCLGATYILPEEKLVELQPQILHAVIYHFDDRDLLFIPAANSYETQHTVMGSALAI